MRKIVIFLILFKSYLAIFFVLSLFVHSSTQWNQHRQRGFINIPADFSFGSDSAYNLPETSPSGTSLSTQPLTQTSTYAPPITTVATATSVPSTRTSTSGENLIYGVSFDCTGKPTGFYKDPKYCDLIHVCVGSKQKKTYPCPQVGGDKFYYDESTRRCEAAASNPNGCPANQYYQSSFSDQSSVFTSSVTTQRITTQAPVVVEAWRQYVRKNDAFTCAGNQDGFYASKWCNVFYRCYIGLKFEFLCAKQTNGDRLWWVQHSTSQSIPQASAACGFPCDLNKACTSPGGVLVDNAGVISDSTSDANRIFSSCSSNNNNNNNYNNQQNNNDTGSNDDFFRLPEVDNSCSGISDGTFISDNKYCNIFHVCIGGKRKDFLCAKAVTTQYELWWNDATKTCEWPCKLKCNKQIFGSNGRTAADIQTLDRNLNGPECDAGNLKLL